MNLFGCILTWRGILHFTTIWSTGETSLIILLHTSTDMWGGRRKKVYGVLMYKASLLSKPLPAQMNTDLEAKVTDSFLPHSFSRWQTESPSLVYLNLQYQKAHAAVCEILQDTCIENCNLADIDSVSVGLTVWASCAVVRHFL